MYDHFVFIFIHYKMEAKHFTMSRHSAVENQIYHLFTDFTLSSDMRSREYATIINQHANLQNEIFIEMGDKTFVPVNFTPQDIQSINICIEPLNYMRVMRVKFQNSTNDSEVLVAEECREDRLRPGYINKIYISNQCTSDMAATAYFALVKLNFLVQFSVFSKFKLAKCMMQRYGSELYPTNRMAFFCQKMQAIQVNVQQIMKQTRDYLLRSTDPDRLTLCVDLNKTIRDIAKDSWRFVDCYNVVDKQKWHFLFQSRFGFQTFITNGLGKEGFLIDSTLHYNGKTFNL